MITEFRIYNNNCTRFIYSSATMDTIINEYEFEKDNHTNPNSPRYGDKLVGMVEVPSGITFSASFYWRESLKWRPRLYWSNEAKFIQWLFFVISINTVYGLKIGAIIRDHLSEAENI